MSSKYSIVVDKTASFYTLGNIETAKTIWFVLHGYGMLAEYFIKKFEPIIDNDTCVIAPEGLSKFYTQGLSGRVGASWMTKHDRKEEIKDYVNYLNKLYHYVNDINSNVDKINLLGFSQGGATVSRWAANQKIGYDNLILWSSVFPDDMDFGIVNSKNTFILYGDDDEFATNERVKKQQTLLSKADINFKIIPFKGKHDIPVEVLIREKENNGW